MALVLVIVAAVSAILGYGVAVMTGAPTLGILHIDKTGEADNYTFEMFDLNDVESKSSVNLQIDVKQ